MFLRKLKLSTMITALVCLVVLVSLLITDILFNSTIKDTIEENLEERAIILSNIVARSDEVINGLKNEEHVDDIQEYANEILEATNVLYVVVMDMNGIRLSHPIPERIGGLYSTEDHKAVLHGKQYVSVSKGTMGNSLKAFTPIYDENKVQIGAVSVGISLERIDDAVNQGRKNILIATNFGLLVGIVCAYFVARFIKQILFGLEPLAIAKILEERNTMLQSVREGVIAVDQDSKITLVNKSAKRMFKKAGLSEIPIGLSIQEYMPSFNVENVLKTGKSELDEEYSINGVSILLNKVPLIVNKEVVGAIATFRDKTEINQLAEQLTGVKAYAEALRAQSHEFMNKLHVILGMVRMGMYEQLTMFINTLVDHRNHEVGNVTKNIKDPALAGFIMGKLSYAREKKVDLSIEIETVLPEPKSLSATHEIITILGNLIDNAIEAMEDSPTKEIEVLLNYFHNSLKIIVSDTGPGISKDVTRHVFEKGFSTKGQNRGYGLYLIRQSVDRLGGEINVHSRLNNGTEFVVVVPFETKKGDDAHDQSSNS
ncbi:DcuS/MalK family sensor histidine kinase [Schinkia azotoformans]|uniref:DcuS/MalK family sensor histidine kinase n=1 Tax=Schinkia azotoformans TaxID=1454 RepID=UPI002DBE9DFB|nr:DcuS/MalK family sensor histidine kinase [Schinkia azotoformans]MEC1719849.1 DcuS/MalK family sensor histidine kinase [Schinkia azotoformans]MED4412583.1 DcuS/MalK family sensor histidine kinase [Schinkia azotoformans]